MKAILPVTTLSIRIRGPRGPGNADTAKVREARKKCRKAERDGYDSLLDKFRRNDVYHESLTQVRSDALPNGHNEQSILAIMELAATPTREDPLAYDVRVAKWGGRAYMVSSRGGGNTRPTTEHEEFELTRNLVRQFKSQSRGKAWSDLCWNGHKMQSVKLPKPRLCSNCKEMMPELIEVGYCDTCKFWSCLTCMYQAGGDTAHVHASTASSSASWAPWSSASSRWSSTPYEGRSGRDRYWRKKD